VNNSSNKWREWVTLFLLVSLPSGVFVWGCIDPGIIPAAIDFAKVAFGSVAHRLATGQGSKRPRLDKKPD
jgi:hypothetical protein